MSYNPHAQYRNPEQSLAFDVHSDCTATYACARCLERKAGHGGAWLDHYRTPISWCERDRISADGP